MREEYRFFDSTAEDTRSYIAEEFAAYFRAFFGDGVKAIGENLQITPDETGLQVIVAPGIAAIQGYFYAMVDDGSGAFVLQHAAPDASARYDRIVLRLDRSTETRSIAAQILKGTPGASPQPPALTRNDTVWEISLAKVAIAPGASSLTSANITDEREDVSVCGLVGQHIYVPHGTGDPPATGSKGEIYVKIVG